MDVARDGSVRYRLRQSFRYEYDRPVLSCCTGWWSSRRVGTSTSTCASAA